MISILQFCRIETPCSCAPPTISNISFLRSALNHLLLIAPTNPHSFFFCRIVSSTAYFVKARSYFSNSRFNAS